MDVFPITQKEATALHGFGWSSGFGWADQFDWYHEPSAGPPICVEDEPKYMDEFLADLAHIRRKAREELMRAKAVELYSALEQCAEYFEARQDVNWEGDGPNEEMSMLQEVLAALDLGKGDRS